MNAQNTPLRLIENPGFASLSHDRSHGRVGVGIILALASLTLLPLLITRLVEPAEPVTQVPFQSVPAEMAPTEYFPAQYQNQAQNSAPEEHIEAF
jgi:hypothetical protein